MTTTATPLSGPAAAASVALKKLGKSVNLVKLDLGNIFMDITENMREEKTYQEEAMLELRNSIEQTGGIVTPLQVVPIDREALSAEDQERIGQCEYMLCAGFRRYICLTELANDDPAFALEVPCCVQDIGNNEVAYRVCQMVENIARQRCTPTEMAESYQSLIEEFEIKQKEVATLLGQSEGSISQYLGILRLPKEIIDEIKNEERVDADDDDEEAKKSVSFSHARELVRLYTELKENEDTEEDQAVTKEKLSQFVKAARSKTYPVFKRDVDAAIAKLRGEGGEDTTTSETKSVKVRTGKDLTKKYLPEFQKRAKDATGSEKTAWNIRVEMLRWMCLDEKSKLNAALAEWEAELAAHEAEEKEKKEETRARAKFINQIVKAVREAYRKLPEEGQVRPTIAQCFAKARKDLTDSITKLIGDGKDVKETIKFELTIDKPEEEGATDTSINKLMDDVTVAYQEKEQALKDAQKKREEKKAKEEAEKKAEEAKAAKEEKAAAS